MRYEPVGMLLVENNPGDERLTLKAPRKLMVANKLYAVSDGVEAMALLRREGGLTDALRPGLFLLDLNLPQQDGREALALTSSQAERDILDSYRLGANCYTTKCVELNESMSVVQSIEDLWLTTARLLDGNA